MDLRRGNCSIAVLMLSLAAPSESQLSSVPPKLIITLRAFLFLNSVPPKLIITLRAFLFLNRKWLRRKIFKITAIQSIMDKILFKQIAPKGRKDYRRG